MLNIQNIHGFHIIMHTVKHILIQMCIYSKRKRCDSKYKIKFLENMLTFLHFLFNDSKSFFQCLKSFFQCLKCRFLQTMLNKVFSQLKSTTMASVRPKLVKQGQWVQCSTWLHAVHVPVFYPNFTI